MTVEAEVIAAAVNATLDYVRMPDNLAAREKARIWAEILKAYLPETLEQYKLEHPETD